jgi:magnesium transporter
MIRIVAFQADGRIIKGLSREDINRVLKSRKGFLWVSIENPTDDELHTTLRDTFHFHPLAIEDAHSVGYQVPKIDDYEEYLFLILHALRINDGLGNELETDEINMFLGKNFLVTITHVENLAPIQFIYQRVDKDERFSRHGPDFLCHSIMDAMVDDYLPLLDKMDEEIEWLEDRVLEKPSPKTLERILSLKHNMLTLRRIISPQREVVNRLSRDDFPVIQAIHRIYFRDIYDHLVGLNDLIESVRDVVSGTLDIYLSATSNRLNEVMKALTIVSTIFLPLTFIAGVYGMNFKYFPEINWPLGYLFVWFLFISLSALMVWYFKRRGWF